MRTQSIAPLLLIFIAVALVSLLYFSLTSQFTPIQESPTFAPLLIEAYKQEGNTLVLYVRNPSPTSTTLTDVLLTVDNQVVEVNVNQTIPPNETVPLSISLPPTTSDEVTISLGGTTTTVEITPTLPLAVCFSVPVECSTVDGGCVSSGCLGSYPYISGVIASKSTIFYINSIALDEERGLAFIDLQMFLIATYKQIGIIDIDDFNLIATKTLATAFTFSASSTLFPPKVIVIPERNLLIMKISSYLYFLDYTNELNLILLATYSWSTLNIEKSSNSNYMFLVDTNYNLNVIDIANETNIVWVRSYNTPGNVYGLYSLNERNLLLVADYNTGLLIFDESALPDLTLVGYSLVPKFAVSIHVFEERNLAIVIDINGYLYFFDISNPATPQLIKKLFAGVPRQVSGVIRVLKDRNMVITATESGLSFFLVEENDVRFLYRIGEQERITTFVEVAERRGDIITINYYSLYPYLGVRHPALYRLSTAQFFQNVEQILYEPLDGYGGVMSAYDDKNGFLYTLYRSETNTVLYIYERGETASFTKIGIEEINSLFRYGGFKEY